jgi:hypothetical protein
MPSATAMVEVSFVRLNARQNKKPTRAMRSIRLKSRRLKLQANALLAIINRVRASATDRGTGLWLIVPLASATRPPKAA